MGLCVVGFGLLDMCFWFFMFCWVFGLEFGDVIVMMLVLLMGVSSQVLFVCVGGGIFMKVVDVGVDLVGKVEKGIFEDDF